jgi:deoxyadenosine/deoxycytidine kinase
MNELEINCYNIWFDWLEKNHFKKPDAIIYLQCSPEKCQLRVKERSRSEDVNVPLEYLQELHDYHEEWINNTDIPTLIINNDVDNNFDMVIKEINSFIDMLYNTFKIFYTNLFKYKKRFLNFK